MQLLFLQKLYKNSTAVKKLGTDGPDYMSLISSVIITMILYKITHSVCVNYIFSLDLQSSISNGLLASMC